MDTKIPIALDVDAAARSLGIAPSTLAKLRLTGTGSVYHKLGRRVVYLPEALAAHLESRKRRSTSEGPIG
jgi:hypothetical protein